MGMVGVRTADSLLVERRGVRLMGAGGGSARMEVAMDSLRALPTGAGYRADSGVAHASVTMGSGGRLVVRADCDSVDAMLEYYEAEVRRLRSAVLDSVLTGTVRTEHAVREGVGGRLKWGLAGLLAGLLAGFKTLVPFYKYFAALCASVERKRE